MAKSERGISNGPNSRSLDDTVAQTGPGIPDDAVSAGYDPVADTQAQHDKKPTEAVEPPGDDTLFNGP